MYLTKEIELKYNITRQSINNYINNGYIEAPSKDNKGRYIWNEENLKQLESHLKNKNNNTELSERKLKIQNRRYLGSKQKMLDFILEVVNKYTTDINVVADVFAGTGVVADRFNKLNKKVIVNDLLYSNYISYLAWFGNEKVNMKKISEIIKELNAIEGEKGYVYKCFGNKYFSRDNAMKIDSIRNKISEIKNVNERERAILLTSLLYAMDKIANTVGHYDSYRKKMDQSKEIMLKVPDTFNKIDNEVYNMDANELVRKIKADLVYVDTPYNSRGYENAYHVLENIIEWKKPAVEGVARKAVDRRKRTSAYTKVTAKLVFEDLIQNINARYILVSYNNMEKKGNSRSNAKITSSEIIEILKNRGNVQVFDTDFSPFTTGKSKIENHKEVLYLCEVINEKREK